MSPPAIQDEPGAAAVVPAAVSAPSTGVAGVSWWREAASLLGIAPIPRPGETAEPAPVPAAQDADYATGSGDRRTAEPVPVPVPVPAAQDADYVIGSGDQLGISVWRDEHLTKTVVVLPDGKISFPLVGELVAGGKTVAQLKEELQGKLTRFVSDAVLSVEVKQAGSMNVYILGRVNNPGRQSMTASTNVLQALAMAGGLNPFAKGEVKVFRRQEGRTTVFSFDYDEVAQGRHLETNVELKRGDVVIAP